jgi:hypothetical protein
MDPTRRDDCRVCGHARDTHVKETLSTGNLERPLHISYRSCLAAWCDCQWYEEPRRD